MDPSLFQIERFIKLAEEEEADDEAPPAPGTPKQRKKELELFHTWKANGKKEEHLEPLIKSLQPLIRKETNKRMTGLGGSMPKSAIEAALRNSAVRSLKTYNPERAALSTHVYGGFRRISDFVNANRNARYVPGADMKRFDTYRNAMAEAHYELGRPPTAQELHERLGGQRGFSVKNIQKMQKSFGKDLYTEYGDGLTARDNSEPQLIPRDAFHQIRDRLKPQEVEFGKLYYPPEGEKQPAISNIAKALGVPNHRAYRLKANVEKRMEKILKGQ